MRWAAGGSDRKEQTGAGLLGESWVCGEESGASQVPRNVGGCGSVWQASGMMTLMAVTACPMRQRPACAGPSGPASTERLLRLSGRMMSTG